MNSEDLWTVAKEGALSSHEVASVVQAQAMEVSRIWNFYSVVALGVVTVVTSDAANCWKTAGLVVGWSVFAFGSYKSLSNAQTTLKFLAVRANHIWAEAGQDPARCRPFKSLPVRRVMCFHIVLSIALALFALLTSFINR